MAKRLTIIGSGTAGCLSLIHFFKYTDYEINWIADENIKPQAVGEGSTITLPSSLNKCIKFYHTDLEKVDGTFKTGVQKINWNGNGNFYHHFWPPTIGYHFNAVKLQEFIKNWSNDIPRINRINLNVTDHSEIDSDFIIDCSGKPSDYNDYIESKCIPVNSVYVTQCYWEWPRFNHTIAIARPYGWVFVIPLINRCSIGYMYNKDINTLEEIKDDVKHIFEEYNLEPSEHTNNFSFKNYYRKNNIVGRSVYNGNASFFLEPLEATSIDCMDTINRQAFDYFNNPQLYLEYDQNSYRSLITETENIIALHYLAGSKFKTKFWETAEKNATTHLETALQNPKLLKFLTKQEINTTEYYGVWTIRSFIDNIKGLDLYHKLNDSFKNIHGYNLYDFD